MARRTMDVVTSATLYIACTPRIALRQLHREAGASHLRCAAIEHLGDVRVLSTITGACRSAPAESPSVAVLVRTLRPVTPATFSQAPLSEAARTASEPAWQRCARRCSSILAGGSATIGDGQFRARFGH